MIGSFGMPTPGKGFELIIDAVNREFDEAIVRINIAPASEATNTHVFKLHNQDYTEYLRRLCEKVARKGVKVEVTREYMSKGALIAWCAQNTLNCFLYNRHQPGLSATTDQAITSGRPLAISTNETFRHIHPYITPYPFQSLKESIASSQPKVWQIQKDWNPRNFAGKLEEVLTDFKVFADPVPARQAQAQNGSAQLFVLPTLKPAVFVKPSLLIRAKNKSKRVLKPILEKYGILPRSGPTKATLSNQLKLQIKVAQQPRENTILVVSHHQTQCGIHQYGLNITEALQKSTRYSFAYAECSSEDQLKQAIIQTNPSAIVYNHYPATMPWLTGQITRQYRVPQLGIMHEVTQEEADKATNKLFDYHLCPDPTLVENNPIVFKTRRLIPPYLNYSFVPDVVTIGSFGLVDKGFEQLISKVQSEFDRAKIVLQSPVNGDADRESRKRALAITARCQQIITKPGIELSINYVPFNKHQLLGFLASNTMNVFFYNAQEQPEVIGIIEYALAVQRPLAIDNCKVFQSVSSEMPRVCVENYSLRQIIDNDTAPLVPFYNEWSEANFILSYEGILDKVLTGKKPKL